MCEFLVSAFKNHVAGKEKERALSGLFAFHLLFWFVALSKKNLCFFFSRNEKKVNGGQSVSLTPLNMKEHGFRSVVKWTCS